MPPPALSTKDAIRLLAAPAPEWPVLEVLDENDQEMEEFKGAEAAAEEPWAWDVAGDGDGEPAGCEETMEMETAASTRWH